MYIGADWEDVNSIAGIYTVTILPNTYCHSFLMVYVYV
jgi:hypothetical protein